MSKTIPYNLDWRSGINDPAALKTNQQSSWGDPGADLAKNLNTIAKTQIAKSEIPVPQKTIEEMPEIYL